MAEEAQSTNGLRQSDLGETADIASGASDKRPQSTQNKHLPTDSMVTVRLSTDTTSSKEPVTSPPVRNSPGGSVRKSIRFSFLGSLEKSDTLAQQDEVAVDDVPEASDPADRPESLSMSTGSVHDDDSIMSPQSTIRSRSDSSGTLSSNGSAQVDWDELEKSEEQAPRHEGSDEATAFLLARLEQENDALATDPKAKLTRARSTRKGTKARPPSMQQLKKLVNEPTRPSLRYSMLPEPPPMTELEFWAALVNDYPQTAQRLPTLTAHKIRGGIPPPLRGVVWVSIAGARDKLLEEEYDRLSGETSPYENLIGKDIGRSFPGVEMFRDPSGEGQQMLAQVLKCFSLYDDRIGYCQGLGFVVGPMLMHMADREAFCVLVRLMEHYDLRSCFLPDLSGLHLRIYQFQNLLSKHHPDLSQHLESIGVEPLYVSQWFLSFFAITCPLPMLLRIYDVLLTEGASETLMRVALSLMRRNEPKLLACTELEDAMSLLLGRPLWDTYGCDADDLVNDFVGLTGLVTREILESLEKAFKCRSDGDTMTKEGSLPNIQAAASRFLGRFWTGAIASTTGKITSPTSSLGVAPPARPSSFLQRTPSKQSMASTLNSIETVDSQLTTSTEATAMSRNPSADCSLGRTATASIGTRSQDRDLHGQIEDLLTALSDMQREQTLMVTELQKEQEDREEDRKAVQAYLGQMKPQTLDAISEIEGADSDVSNQEAIASDSQDPLDGLRARFSGPSTNKRSSLLQQTKQEMREQLKLWKDQYEIEAARSADLTRQISDEQKENNRITEQFREARDKMQEIFQEKQQLEKTVAELKIRRYSTESDFESVPQTPVDTPPPSAGLRELKLVRTGSLKSNNQSSAGYAKRSSSLGMTKVLATEGHKPPSEESMLVELVNAKTAEAVARQELEEVKNKLDSLRRIMGSGSSGNGSNHRPTPSESTIIAKPAPEPPKLTPPSTSSGGFFSGWGKRTASNPAVTVTVAAET
ncbi:uncharacterized protein KY384_007107 [Bacidia gigantensis]|uniref:uncharacterized protein n=1 Tax=Bacidia gigantensis TaxID=2732470 RepID=UPI001D039578|nr:uncharacterized protein KY384_007107 [Bacidia gigantensis]KAG8528190.1 hypothetical protein KY384_007107 [Bacidia gigantensis]